jgi:ABC-2 type transport system permease protein
LLSKEIRRFLRVPGQTIFSPLVTTTLYLLVFGRALGGHVKSVSGVPYLDFIVPGLVFLAIANSAFLNTSSSLFITKIQGTVVDLLVAPLGAPEILIGFIGGGMVRGLLVGLLTWAAAWPFTGLHLAHPLATCAALLLTGFVFSVRGVVAGIWAEKFEQINFVPTFLMLPLTFLGGVFYSVRTLPSPWDAISLANPMVYMVDAMRYAMLGQSVLAPGLGFWMLLGVGAAGTTLALLFVRSGYKLKT